MKKGAKFWALLGTASFAGLLTLIGIIINVFDIKIPIRSFPNIVLGEQINIDYLTKTQMDLHNIYYLFDDDIATQKEYYLNDDCATVISISNHYDEDIEIQKVFFEASEIQQIKEPYLEIDLQNINSGEINVVIKNTGWADSQEFTLSFSGIGVDLSDYFKNEKLSISVPKLSSGESVTLPFLTLEDLIWKPHDTSKTEKIFLDSKGYNCTGDDISIYYKNLEIWIDNRIPYIPGRGAAVRYSYGIKIDSSKDNYSNEESVTDIIEPGEIKTIPLCFFPDQSCKMKARIGFEILHDNEVKKIYSEYRDFTFYISSIPNENKMFDVSEYSVEELKTIKNDPVVENIITYPYY